MIEPTARGLSLRTALAMLAFTVAFTTLMAASYQLTKAPIARSAAEERLRLIDAILPRDSYDNDLLADVQALPPTPELGLESGGTLWRGRRNGQLVALVTEAAAPDGYSGHIGLLVAIRPDGQVLGVRVTEHRETPGLGDYIDPRKDRNKTHPWIAQFSGVPADLPMAAWTVRKDGGQFDSVTGATISPRAVTHAVGRSVAYLRSHVDVLSR